MKCHHVTHRQAVPVKVSRTTDIELLKELRERSFRRAVSFHERCHIHQIIVTALHRSPDVIQLPTVRKSQSVVVIAALHLIDGEAGLMSMDE